MDFLMQYAFIKFRHNCNCYEMLNPSNSYSTSRFYEKRKKLHFIRELSVWQTVNPDIYSRFQKVEHWSWHSFNEKKNRSRSFLYCLMQRSVTFDFWFALGIKPSDITFFHAWLPVQSNEPCTQCLILQQAALLKAPNVWLTSLIP